jgi:hypothetical protein
MVLPAVAAKTEESLKASSMAYSGAGTEWDMGMGAEQTFTCYFSINVAV